MSGFFASILSKVAAAPIKEVASSLGGAANSLLNRAGFTEKLSEADRLDKYVTLFGISESSTDSARQMCMVESQTQKQPWLIRMMNGFVRPFGGIGALITEFFMVWGENLATWFGFGYKEINVSTEQHLVLGAIIAFYFGSRLKETLTGKATAR